MVECDGDTFPTPYMLQVDAVKKFRDGEKLEPCIFLRRIALHSARSDLRALWAWLKNETGDSAPDIWRQMQEFTLRGLRRDLADTKDESDNRILKEVIEAIKIFDFSPGFGKSRKLVRRDEK